MMSGVDRGFVLERTQLVRAEPDRVFRFFEDPMNLERITPPWLRFRVLVSTDPQVRRGTEIDYLLRWQVFPMRWRSRITEYEPGVLFADEMLRGPYRSWYHRHHFRSVPGGVEVRDVVEYTLPCGPIGRSVHGMLIRRQLERIFDYRRNAIASIFAEEAATAPFR